MEDRTFRGVKETVRGRVYETDKAKEIHSWCNAYDHYGAVYWDEKNREFFHVAWLGHPFVEVHPMTDDEARAYLEKNTPDLVSEYFGETGSGQRRIEALVPESLAMSVEHTAERLGLSVDELVALSLHKMTSMSAAASGAAGR